ncbi:probable pectinesterase/pectinesterase inhibitor 51 [Salvia miltiorrhiza]|uniref:probable pectinesterase/pectinesterase inhibitor 51 n=1 Tax=Salvia miltiorrhiza TaxID=226208 RepID=UPI0025AC365C|nr:probable pectinesterase/pectinesterase inhibitor 51 [Salvia miltiorrhiza]
MEQLTPMAAFLSLTLLSLLIVHSSCQQVPSIVHDACKASRDPPACEDWLSRSGHVPPNATALQLIQSSLQIISDDLDKGKAMVQDILNSSAGNQNRTAAAQSCLDMVHYSAYRANLVAGALRRREIKDARAWMSGTLGYKYDCWSALKYVNDTSQVVKTMAFFNSTLIGGGSAALAMLVNYDLYGEKTGSWAPVRTERDGFWEPASGSEPGPGGGVPRGLKADVTVCKSGGGCDYDTGRLWVQKAVDKAPSGSGKRFVIWIKRGVYEETVLVGLEKTDVVLLGDGMGKTVITGSKNAGQPGVSTYRSATVGILGDGFMASNITFQNTAGPETHQAVAFRSDSDRSMMENCEFVSNQDTLYAHSMRQYYKSCRIQGNVDFIFGNAAVVFQDCHILVAPRQQNPEKGEKNAVTAQGRTDPAQSTGLVFQKCVVNGTEAYMQLFRRNPKLHSSFLGRPWKAYSRTVFIWCDLEGIIKGEGWMAWDGEFALGTLYYGEYKNVGSGSDTSGRVRWSNQIPMEHIHSYSIQNFIQGNHWIHAI